MEDLIPLINRLQSVFKKTDINEIKLPQIVVVGAQSSGKSSVLESLVKRSFLPRGTGTVTRCPIIIQLNQIKDNSESQEERCYLSYLNNDGAVAFTDFDKVRKEIERLQVILAGDNKGISMKPIILKVFSPNVIDLTVVDLPGIVKIPVGDQPEDIEHQVYNLIREYIENDSAIILAVSAANADIATSESIKIAQEFDPRGDRTLAVVTKLDLMDNGTNALSVLRGEVINVKLGFVGVVNRSQKDIDSDTSLKDAIIKEEMFLAAHYPGIAEVGSEYLAKRLNTLLNDHIQQQLPDLITRISDLTDDCNKSLADLGKGAPSTPVDAAYIIMDITNDFKNCLNDLIKRRPEGISMSEDEEHFALKVHNAFHSLRQSIVIDQVAIGTERIFATLQRTVNIEGFSSIEEVFKFIVRQEICKMESVAVDGAKNIHDLLVETCKSFFKQQRFRPLNAVIQDAVSNLLKDHLHLLNGRISEYIQAQTETIICNDEAFVALLARVRASGGDGHSNFAFPMSIESGSGDSTASEVETRVSYTQQLINTYLNVKKRDFCDYVSQHAMHHLGHQSLKKVSETIKEATMGREQKLMAESDELRLLRKEKQELLQSLNEASKIIRDIKTGY